MTYARSSGDGVGSRRGRRFGPPPALPAPRPGSGCGTGVSRAGTSSAVPSGTRWASSAQVRTTGAAVSSTMYRSRAGGLDGSMGT